MKIIGIDPGSRLTGYGCVERSGPQLRHVIHGTFSLMQGRQSVAFEDRLLLLYQQLGALINRYQPQVLVVEKVFFAKNPLSALKLGQVRGVVLLVGKVYGLEIAEYNPTEVKKACVGQGQADKEQVARMIQLILGKQHFETLDASDALALAICHAQLSQSRTRGLSL